MGQYCRPSGMALQVDARLLGLFSRIQMRMCELESPRNMMRVIWAVAKVGLKNDEVEAAFTYIANVTPSRLHLFSSQELSNILWGLAKYCEMGSEIPVHHFSKRLALQVLGESSRRLSEFRTQCLTNSLWAVVKMELTGECVDLFCSRCLEQVHKHMFNEISPQGLANSLWACAKLVSEHQVQIRHDIAVIFCIDAARRATASARLLKSFSLRSSLCQFGQWRR